MLLNFLFCTYTGISLVDLERITQDSIKVVKYKDIDYHIIKDNRQKSDTGFITILTSEALELIKIRKKESNSKFIFHVPSCMFYQMDIIRKKSGIEKHFTFHTSRHSFGTYWANKGVSEKVIMKMMGHKSKSANRIYSKILTYGIISETLGKDYKEDH